jgi:hypothetical protein
MLSARGMRNRLMCAVASTLVLSACQKSLPTAPSDTAEGVIVYEHTNFGGKSAYLTADVADLEKFNGPCFKDDIITLPDGRTVPTHSDSWDNCISSVRVAPGWRAILYGDADYRGSHLEVTSDIADLKVVAGGCEEGLNDCISSLRVFRP